MRRRTLVLKHAGMESEALTRRMRTAPTASFVRLKIAAASVFAMEYEALQVTRRGQLNTAVHRQRSRRQRTLLA